MIERALIVDEPWISKILAGNKTWEMRTNPTNIRGRIGLIKKGTGQVVGAANLIGNGPMLTAATYADYVDKHGIEGDRQSSAVTGGWTCAWILKDAQKLGRPVSYRHKPGAVIFVKLEDSVSTAIQSQLT